MPKSNVIIMPGHVKRSQRDVGQLGHYGGAAPKIAFVVVFASKDPRDNPEDWTPLLPEDHPRELSDPDVMALMLAGDIMQVKDDPTWWYRAVALDPKSGQGGLH